MNATAPCLHDRAQVYLGPEIVRRPAYWALSGLATKVLNALAVYRNQHTGAAWPSNDTLAELLGCTKRTVQRGLVQLRKAGFIDGGDRMRSAAKPLRFVSVAQVTIPLPAPEEKPVRNQYPEVVATTAASTLPTPTTVAETIDNRLALAACIGIDQVRQWRSEWPGTATDQRFAELAHDITKKDSDIKRPVAFIESVLSGRTPYRPEGRTTQKARIDIDLMKQRMVPRPEPVEGCAPAIAFASRDADIDAYRADHPDLVADCEGRARKGISTLLYQNEVLAMIRAGLAS